MFGWPDFPRGSLTTPRARTLIHWSQPEQWDDRPRLPLRQESGQPAHRLGGSASGEGDDLQVPGDAFAALVVHLEHHPLPDAERADARTLGGGGHDPDLGPVVLQQRARPLLLVVVLDRPLHPNVPLSM